MTYGAEIWGPPLVSAAASAASGALGASGANKETKAQKQKRELIDQLIASLTGQGPYSDLYRFDEDIFNKSFVEPAQAKFRNQIAPQIQQQFIASGQQRGTGLDDTLTRAGVDMDAMLNQYMYQAQQDALNRKQNTIGSILGSGDGVKNNPTMGENALAGFGGYLGSEGFSDFASSLFKKPPIEPERKGFEPTYPRS